MGCDREKVGEASTFLQIHTSLRLACSKDFQLFLGAGEAG